jgi:hypothetical protein
LTDVGGDHQMTAAAAPSSALLTMIAARTSARFASREMDLNFAAPVVVAIPKATFITPMMMVLQQVLVVAMEVGFPVLPKLAVMLVVVMLLAVMPILLTITTDLVALTVVVVVLVMPPTMINTTAMHQAMVAVLSSWPILSANTTLLAAMALATLLATLPATLPAVMLAVMLVIPAVGTSVQAKCAQ